MKIIKNKFIPFKGFLAINLFGFLFTQAEKWRITPTVINHETIHTKQMKELGYILFYILYGIEYLIKILAYRNTLKAYYNISFEREAYQFEGDLDYLRRRKHYYWFKRIFH